jgi:hypothetical protein
MPNGWTWIEDRQWAASRYLRTTGYQGVQIVTLEVRTENAGVGSMRLGEVFVTETPTGEMLVSLREERG